MSESHPNERSKRTKERTSPPEGATDVAASKGEGDLAEGPTPTASEPRMSAGELVAAWINRRADRPPDAVVSKQGAAAKRLTSTYSRVDLERALDGIGRLFPHSDGQPFDLFDLERKFANAIAATVTNGHRRGGRPTEVDATDLAAWKEPNA